MRLTPIALLTTAAALISGLGISSPAPDASDVTIRTRRTSDGQQAASQTMVLQLKGARRRVSYVFERAGVPAAHASIHITQCDLAREVHVNDSKRIYATVPIPAPRGPWRAVAQDTRPVGETLTVDAVDTGERRQIGPFVARHVVTTATTERAGESRPVSTRVRDGWYLDLPSRCGDDGAIGATFLMAGSASVRTEVKWKGTARTGWAVIETDRTSDAYGTDVSTTSLVEVSTAPLEAGLFDVPEGYRPALPLGHGGFDLERPDTVVNRVRLAVESTASWVHYTWSRLTSSGPTARFTAQ
jgi:hypothetical protein